MIILLSVVNILYRNIKWRFQNPVSIIITIIQPIIWLVLYSAVAGQTMKNLGISNYMAFILPGVMVLVIFASCSSGGIINFLMKSSGSFYRLIIAPVKRSSIVLGQMLEAVLCSIFEVFILYIISLFFSVKIASGFMGILIIIFIVFITAFFMAGIAYTISLLLPNEVVYETVMNIIVLPTFFLSTALFPKEGLSGELSAIVNLNPFTHVINILRRLIFEKTILIEDILPIVLLFLVLCLFSFSLALWRLNKETVH